MTNPYISTKQLSDDSVNAYHTVRDSVSIINWSPSRDVLLILHSCSLLIRLIPRSHFANPNYPRASIFHPTMR